MFPDAFLHVVQSDQTTDILHIEANGLVGFPHFLTVKSSGQVGIGTNTPAARLHIDPESGGDDDPLMIQDTPNSAVFRIDQEGHTGIRTGADILEEALTVRSVINQIALVDEDNSDKKWMLSSMQNLSGFGIVEDNASAHLVIESGGKVGVGTTDPAYQMHIEGGGNALGSDRITVSTPDLNTVFQRSSDFLGQAVGIGFSHSTNPTNIGAAIIHERTGGESQGKLHFATKTSDMLGGNIPIAATIDEGGQVGIGTMTPDNKLTVLDRGSQIALIDAESNKKWTLTSYFDTGFGIEETGVSTPLVIQTGGNVGIGELIPQVKVHVNGGTDASASGGGYIVTGTEGGSQLAFDTNEILARNAYSPSTLHLNAEGGTVAIGATGLTIPADASLAVNGKILCEEVEVQLSDSWADFVFDEQYPLMPLEEVEQHIKEYKHLPDVPSEKEVREHGIDLGKMQAKLLQKVEELMLYTIALKKQNDELKARVSSLEKTSH
jgi:hypothetical protein